MRRGVFLLGLLIALPLNADRLQPSSVNYLGYFTPPPKQGGGNQNTWDWGTLGLTLVPDCLGRPDPSPNDGFPGCIGAFGHVLAFQFGVFDIVPPGGQAQQVVPFYSLGENLPEETLPGQTSVQYWDVLYDNGPNHCRLWWTFGNWYIQVEDDPPFLGVSSCDPNNPDPQGMWDVGPEWSGSYEDDPYHTAKMYQGLSTVPQSVADEYFDGKQMALGLSRKNGVRGGSQGPSFYVRDLSYPQEQAPGPMMDVTPLLWYRHTGYVKWYDNPQMNGGATRHWTGSKEYGMEFVSSPAGEAVVVAWEEPIINPEDYPCSHPTAYRDNDPTTPDPCEVPVCWYGTGQCTSGVPNFQQPSFWEDTTTGVQMPMDCNIVEQCNTWTGPHCLSLRPFLLLYDIEDLAAVYEGRLLHNQPQPYAKIPIEDYFIDGKGCGSASTGSTLDPTRQLLYVAQGQATPAVHVFAIGGGGGGQTFKLVGPEPGLPGVANTLAVEGAEPGGSVLFVGGRGQGSYQVDACKGKRIGFGHARLVGEAAASSEGTASVSLNIPNGLKGKTLKFQALDVKACELSNLVTYAFP